MIARWLRSFLGNVLLNLAALGGLACIALVALAYAFDVTLIMFKTGSMSPAIPAGSVAFVRQIPAAEIAVGDIVTVDREAALPVTHRVTSVAGGPLPGQRVITMKGDANEAEDPAPYTVETVRLTLAHVPGFAKVVVWFANPYVVGGLTLGAAALVTWAFWPGYNRNDDGTHDPKGHGNDAADLDRNGDAPPPDRHAVSRAGLVAGITVIGGTLLYNAAFGAAPAEAAPTEHIIEGRHVRLTSVNDPAQMRNMVPGKPVQWQVGIDTIDQVPGRVRIGLSATGAASMRLHARLALCSERWIDASCPGTTTAAAPRTLAPGTAEQQVAVVPADKESWLLLDVALPAAAAPLAGDSLDVRLHAHGSGDHLDVGLEADLPLRLARTGPESTSLLWLAAGAVAAGLLLALAARVVKRSRAR
ncbi:hypothetical protein D477_010376 [Arthrobacter crystallopoietes BAB-32]|uniref:Signal peptidase I n=1 Tax=Arthrobacter crystallopoietes BAB-32 TaxID=1246476 RepID=N1UV94_9MICC|nr:signal peptidase I [Arthrobacter crystallopoietes]EMY34301.1 hypothetical protein D477_010376 [Arthrobacter crystallopoietes BAB-32]